MEAGRAFPLGGCAVGQAVGLAARLAVKITGGGLRQPMTQLAMGSSDRPEVTPKEKDRKGRKREIKKE